MADLMVWSGLIWHETTSCQIEFRKVECVSGSRCLDGSSFETSVSFPLA